MKTKDPPNRTGEYKIEKDWRLNWSTKQTLSVLSFCLGPAVLRNLSDCVLNSAWEINVPYHIDNTEQGRFIPVTSAVTGLDPQRGLPLSPTTENIITSNAKQTAVMHFKNRAQFPPHTSHTRLTSINLEGEKERRTCGLPGRSLRETGPSIFKEAIFFDRKVRAFTVTGFWANWKGNFLHFCLRLK